MAGKNINDTIRRYRMDKFSKSDRQKRTVSLPYCERCCENCAAFIEDNNEDFGFCEMNQKDTERGGICDYWFYD